MFFLLACVLVDGGRLTCNAMVAFPDKSRFKVCFFYTRRSVCAQIADLGEVAAQPTDKLTRVTAIQKGILIHPSTQ